MVNFEACATFKIDGGTAGGTNGIAAGTDVRLGKTVSAIYPDGKGAASLRS